MIPSKDPQKSRLEEKISKFNIKSITCFKKTKTKAKAGETALWT